MTRQSVAIVAAIGGLLILFSALLQSWWTYSRRKGVERPRTWTYTVGLTRGTVFDGQETESENLGEAADTEEERAWAAGGSLTFWLSIVTSMLLAAAVLVRLADVKVPFPFMRTATVLAGASFLSGCRFFLFLTPASLAKVSSASWGFPVFCLGTVGVVIVGIMDWRGTGKAPPPRRRRRIAASQRTPSSSHRVADSE